MPINEGESLEQFDARLRREAAPKPKNVAEMSEPERRAAEIEFSKPNFYTPQLPAHLADKRVETMTLDERRLCARILNIHHA